MVACASLFAGVSEFFSPQQMAGKGNLMTKAEYAQQVEDLLPLLTRKARRLVGRDEAPDVVHNAVLNVWRARCAGIADLRALLIAAVKNAAADYLASGDRTQSTGCYLDREPTRPAPATEDDLVRGIDVRRAIDALPPDVSYALVAVHVEGATWGDVARELGVDDATLHRRVKQHLPALRARLGEIEDPASPSVRGEETK